MATSTKPKQGAPSAAPAKKPVQSTGTDQDVSLEDLFKSDVRDTLWIEQHLVKSIPKMIDAAGSKELKDALKQHLKITQVHVSRAEQALAELGTDAIPKKCDALEGLTISGEKTIEMTAAGSKARDAGIIMCGRKVENFETIHYTGLIETANKLGLDTVSKLFQQTLDEEIKAGNILAELANA